MTWHLVVDFMVAIDMCCYDVGGALALRRELVMVAL